MTGSGIGIERTNVTAALLDVYEHMSRLPGTITPPVGWSCVQAEHVVSIGLDGLVSGEEAVCGERWHNDADVQPVPLNAKTDTNPWKRWGRDEKDKSGTTFGCTRLAHLLPDDNRPAKAHRLYAEVLGRIESEDMRRSLEPVLAALSDKSLWDGRFTKKQLAGNAIVEVYVTSPDSLVPKRVCLHKIPEVAAAWNSFYHDQVEGMKAEIRESRKELADRDYVDVATGEVGDIVRSQCHTKAFLVSAGKVCPILSCRTDKHSFVSYGFVGVDHGSVSFETDAKMSSASDWLKNSGRYVNVDDLGTRLFFWGPGVDDNLTGHVRSLFRCGKDEDVNVSYLLDKLSGDAVVNVMELRPNMARMSVRGISTHRLRDLVERRIAWSDHIRMVGVSSLDLGRHMYFWKELDGPKTTGRLCDSVRRCAVFGEPMSESVLSALANMVRRDSAEAAGDRNCRRMGARAALMRACLIEACGQDIKEELMLDSDDAMYNLGRMIAVCARAQHFANGKRNVRKRFVSAAAQAPHATIAKVMDAYTLYSSLVAKENKGRAAWLEKIWLDALGCGGKSIADGLPEYSSNEQKIQLYLGFYQQNEEFVNLSRLKHLSFPKPKTL